jgi:hypothetical protein
MIFQSALNKKSPRRLNKTKSSPADNSRAPKERTQTARRFPPNATGFSMRFSGIAFAGLRQRSSWESRKTLYNKICMYGLYPEAASESTRGYSPASPPQVPRKLIGHPHSEIAPPYNMARRGPASRAENDRCRALNRCDSGQALRRRYRRLFVHFVPSGVSNRRVGNNLPRGE